MGLQGNRIPSAPCALPCWGCVQQGGAGLAVQSGARACLHCRLRQGGAPLWLTWPAATHAAAGTAAGPTPLLASRRGCRRVLAIRDASLRLQQPQLAHCFNALNDPYCMQPLQAHPLLPLPQQAPAAPSCN